MGDEKPDAIVPAAIPGQRKPGEEATEVTPTPAAVDQPPEQSVLQDRRRPKEIA